MPHASSNTLSRRSLQLSAIAKWKSPREDGSSEAYSCPRGAVHGTATQMHAPIASTSALTDYRPDIDGLRAVAVLSVMAYHYGAPLPAEWRLSGGFTGVDVFFVISGFLITSKLRDDIAAGTFFHSRILLTAASAGFFRLCS